MSRGAGPTKRDLDIIAAWWFAKGSYPEASKLLGIGHQPVKNALYLFRRTEGAVSNLDLAMRYQDEIRKRQTRFMGGRRRSVKKAA